MAAKESNLQREIRLRASQRGARLFRNNVGFGYVSTKKAEFNRTQCVQLVNLYPGDCVLRKARPIKFGLQKGSGDEIGWTPLIIKPEMVGKQIAVFTSVEVKTKTGKPSTEQKNWHNVIKKSGGYSVVARDADTVIQALELPPFS